MTWGLSIIRFEPSRVNGGLFSTKYNITSQPVVLSLNPLNHDHVQLIIGRWYSLVLLKKKTNDLNLIEYYLCLTVHSSPSTRRRQIQGGGSGSAERADRVERDRLHGAAGSSSAERDRGGGSRRNLQGRYLDVSPHSQPPASHSPSPNSTVKR